MKISDDDHPKTVVNSKSGIGSLGTIDNPYKIANCESLQNITYNLNAHYVLTQDIDCSDTKNWNNGAGFAPIGDSDQNSFKGTFHGNKYVISQLYINRPKTSKVGLFGDADGNIADISLKDITIIGYNFVGGLVGLNLGGMIKTIYSTGNIRGYGGAVGGLIGQNDFILTHSYSAGKVTGSSYVGGLVGSNYKVIANAYSTATVTGTRGNIVGGLVGSNWATVFNTYSYGQVRSAGGGLSGFSGPGAKTLDSYWDMQASGKSTSAGGIGKTTVEMHQQSTYQGWNFYYPWKIENGISYPTLRSAPLEIVFVDIPSPQTVNKPFPVTLVADSSTFIGDISLCSNRGKVSPTFVRMINGKWSGKVKLYDVGRENILALRWISVAYDASGTSVSNMFNVTNENSKIPSEATIIGKVTDDNNNPIAKAVVQLSLESPTLKHSTVQQSTFTDIYGNYNFTYLPAEDIFLTMHKFGYQNVTVSVRTAENMAVSGNTELSPACSASETSEATVPILLLPGIMGSSSNWIDLPPYPTLPCVTPPWDATYAFGLFGTLTLFNPFEIALDIVGWRKLRQSLKKVGYTKDCTLFDVPYDWSLPIEMIRDQFLLPWIQEAKRKSNSTKVDIIAHSMGGLVARSYIQSSHYQGDVRKLAMVGTPNKGADTVYYMWEGGDPIKADQVSGSSENWFLGQYFYSNTLDYLFKTRVKSQLQPCEFGSIWKFNPFVPKFCDNNAIYNMFHTEGKSSSQLVPIYDNALLNYLDHQPVYIEKEENTFLRALNNLNCRNPRGCVDSAGNFYYFKPSASVLTNDERGVETKLFVGIKQNTPKSIYVKPQPPNYSGMLYQDGIPQELIDGNGDGSVLNASVIFNDYRPPGTELTYIEKNGTHEKLIKIFTSELVNFMRGNILPIYSASHEKSSILSIIDIIMEGRIKPTLIGPKNKMSLTKKFALGYSNIQVSNPVYGKYIVKLESPYHENYKLSIFFMDIQNKVINGVRVSGYYDTTLSSFTFAINQQAINNTIQFDRAFSPPLEPLMQNSSDHRVLLTWKDPANNTYHDVNHYDIYWRPNDEPYFHFLNRTVEKIYQTNLTWIKAILNTYVVKSVLRNGNSTFFSPPTWTDVSSTPLLSSESLKTSLEGTPNALPSPKHSSSPKRHSIKIINTPLPEDNNVSIIEPISSAPHALSAFLNQATFTGQWDSTVYPHPCDGKPVFVYRLYHDGSEMGSASFYGQPQFCRSVAGDQHNVLELTGVLSEIDLEMESAFTENICTDLPPTYGKQLAGYACQASAYGAVRGLGQVVNYTFQKSGAATNMVALLVGALVQYGGVYAISLVSHYMRHVVNHDDLTHAILEAAGLAVIDLMQWVVLDLGLQVVQHIFLWLEEYTRVYCGWNKRSDVLQKVGHWLPYSIYARQLISGDVLPATVSLGAGTIAQKVIEGAGKAGVDRFFSSRQSSALIKEDPQPLFSI